MKVRDLAIAMIVVQCVGNPGLFFKHKKWPEFLPTIRGGISAFLLYHA